jgi:hypothetical protein
MTLARAIIVRRIAFCTTAGLCILSAAGSGAAQSKSKKTGPETFNAKATVDSQAGRGDAHVTIRIDQYTPEKNLEVMERALKSGGSSGFVTELRRAPVAGRFELATQSFAIRWARQTDTSTGRTITAIVDKPVYFVGGGVPGAKSREGYDVAVIQLTMDSSGVGEGTMTAAARIKPGGPTGVEVDAYETAPVKLRSVMKLIQ